jgi:hypothetical protein
MDRPTERVAKAGRTVMVRVVNPSQIRFAMAAASQATTDRTALRIRMSKTPEPVSDVVKWDI